MSTITDVSTLVVVSCANCAIQFAMPAKLEAQRRDDHETFYCPAGHRNYYPGKSEAEKLRDQLVRERAERDQVQAHATRLQARVDLKDRQLRARKAVTTKLKRRIEAGKCPCCRATFADLRTHMTQRHPDWSPGKAARAMEAKG